MRQSHPQKSKAGPRPSASRVAPKPSQQRKTSAAPAYRSGNSAIEGKGVFARREIRKGERIGEYQGPEASRNGKYVLWVDGEGGRSGRNALRYLNHSLLPNAEFDGFELFALRKIKEDEEITFDYGDPSFEFYYAGAEGQRAS